MQLPRRPLRTITELFDTADLRAFHYLEKFGLMDHYIDIMPTRLRSRFKYCTKQLAKTERVNQLFAWRIARYLRG